MPINRCMHRARVGACGAGSWILEHTFYYRRCRRAFAELHCHSNFSFLDGASSVEDLVERAVELGLTGLALTDHQGLMARFALPAPPTRRAQRDRRHGGRAARPGRRRTPTASSCRGAGASASSRPTAARVGAPTADRSRSPCPRVERLRPPGHREPQARGPARRPRARARSASRAARPRHDRLSQPVPARQRRPAGRHEGRAAVHPRAAGAETEGLIALSGCRHGEIARRLLAGDREGRSGRRAPAGRAIFDGTLLPRAAAPPAAGRRLAGHGDGRALADELGLPTGRDQRRALRTARRSRAAGRAGRASATASRSRRAATCAGRTASTTSRASAELRCAAAGERARWATASRRRGRRGWRRRWRSRPPAARSTSTSSSTASRASRCPRARRAFSYLETLCHDGHARALSPADAGGREAAGPRDGGHRAHRPGRVLPDLLGHHAVLPRPRASRRRAEGSAGDSIVAYVLGITRVDPIRHKLLFERFINEGRTSYPDVDIDFASSRREEVIQYCYERYGAEHTGMVCNLVTYRARSAVREVGYALGFPRPLVDRVAKALETYDWSWSGATWRPRAASPSSSRRHPRWRLGGRVRFGGRVGGAGRGSRLLRRDGPAQRSAAASVRSCTGRRETAGPARRAAALTTKAARAIRRCQRPLAAARDASHGGPRRGRDGEVHPGADPSAAADRPRPGVLRHAESPSAQCRRASTRAAEQAPAAERSRSSMPGSIAASAVNGQACLRTAPDRPSTVGHVAVGALARADRAHRRVPAPSVDPHRRHAHHAGAADRHRAARASHDARPCRGPIRQTRHRDDQTHQARPARPAHAQSRSTTRCATSPPTAPSIVDPRPPARGHPRGLPHDPGGGHGGRLPDRVARPDADAAPITPGDARRPRRRGGDHPARAHPGQRRPSLPAPAPGQGSRSPTSIPASSRRSRRRWA